MRTLEDLFLNSLAEIYYAENQLLQSLSKLARADRDEKSAEELESLLEQTELYVKEVERVFAEFSQKARAENCNPFANYLGQRNKMVTESKGLRAINTALIAQREKVENHLVAA